MTPLERLACPAQPFAKVAVVPPLIDECEPPVDPSTMLLIVLLLDCEQLLLVVCDMNFRFDAPSRQKRANTVIVMLHDEPFFKAYLRRK